jgi:ribosome maturation factor RimP
MTGWSGIFGSPAALQPTFPTAIFFVTHHSPRLQGGGLDGPPFFVLDVDFPLHTGLEARIAGIVAPTLADMGYELVRVVIVGRERPTVQIMADRADGAAVGVGDCEAITHAVGAVLDVEDLIPGRWTLEVSSAGIDRPLTRKKDWNRFAGHLARAEVAVPVSGQKRFSGIVLGADDNSARMRLDDGTEVALPWANVRRAKLVLTDALIEATAQMTTTN